MISGAWPHIGLLMAGCSGMRARNHNQCLLQIFIKKRKPIEGTIFPLKEELLHQIHS